MLHAGASGETWRDLQVAATPRRPGFRCPHAGKESGTARRYAFLHPRALHAACPGVEREEVFRATLGVFCLSRCITGGIYILSMTPLSPPPSSLDWLAISSAPLDPAAAISFVTDPRAGGIAVFLGTTRAEINATGEALVALDYEAFEAMADAQLRDLALRARLRGDVVHLAIHHRVGRVDLGAPSVVIAVSTPHRAEAFEICRWLIDTLKAEVAIWKKEVWADGPGEWVLP